MAGPLTWRNVDAPDFRSSMQGYQMFSNMLGDAFRSAGDLVGGFRREQGQAADREILSRALTYQDPQALREALATGTLLSGVNTKAASNEVLSGLGGRVGTLLGQAGQQQALDQNVYTFGRTKDVNARMDAASPALAQFYAARDRGDVATAQKIWQENQATLGQLAPDQLAAALTTGQGLSRGELGQRQGEFGLGRDQYNLGVAKRDDEEARAAQQLALEVFRSSGSPDDAAAAIERSTASEQVKAQALGRIQQAFPGTYGMAPGAGGGGTAGTLASAQGTAGTQAGSPFDTVVGFGQFGNSTKPITSMNLGEAVEFGKQVLIPGTRGNASLGLSGNQGSSAMGAYQLTQGTITDIAPKVFGKDWKNIPMTAENQDKIAEALFNERKGGNLKETWVSLPNSAAGAYKNKSWAEVRDEITQGEVGKPVTALLNQAATAAGMTGAARLSQNQDTGVSPDLASTINDTRDVSTIANELLEGPLAGSDRRTIINQLNRVMSEGNTNAATAGAVLRRNIEASPGSPFSLGGALEWLQYGANRVISPFESSANLGNGMRFNDDGIAATIDQLRTGQPLDQTAENLRVAQATATVTQAQQQLAQAQAQYRQMVQRAQTRPAMKENLPRYEAQVQAAQQRLQEALMLFGSNPDNRARFDATRRETAAPPAARPPGRQLTPEELASIKQLSEIRM
jgi:hypothetical protein